MAVPCVFILLCAVVGTCLAVAPCDPANYPEGTKLPAFMEKEFTADVEMSDQQTNKVSQVRMVYSEHYNHIKMSILDAQQSRDIYFIGNEGKGEVLWIDYSQGRGSCLVSSFADEVNGAMFFVGGGIRRHSINTPLRMLRLSGPSGFGDGSEIKLKQGAQFSTVRGMAADGYESCQKWTSGGVDTVLKVEHYFSKPGNPWKPPSSHIGKSVPLMMRVTGENFQHTYSFFRFRPYIDARELETPAGVYCKGRQKVNFPDVPEQIHFTGELIDNAHGDYYFMEEMFDTRNQFAIMKEKGKTIFREYTSGLNFQIIDSVGTCNISNITDARNAGKLPFDFQADGGIAKQLSANQFFYKGDNTYEYVGPRRVRGILTEAFITKAPLINDPGTTATMEWYFAKHSTNSWNDNVAVYRDTTERTLRMPVLFRTWLDDTSSQSVDVNFFAVDYSRILFGYINLRPCFPDSPFNHFQLILPGVPKMNITKNLEVFKWYAVYDIGMVMKVQWWRITDFQVLYNKNDVIIEFEVVDPPPMVTDVVLSSEYVTLYQAQQNLIAALNSNFQIKVWDQATLEPSKGVPTKLGYISL